MATQEYKLKDSQHNLNNCLKIFSFLYQKLPNKHLDFITLLQIP